MVDTLMPERRSANMSRIRSRDTKPELVVRRMLHAAGFRFRLNVRTLPGSPDIVLPKYKIAIFVHGCFWHRHPGCKYAYSPKSRVDFWMKKFEENVARDRRAQVELERLGWSVVTLWQCEVEHGVRSAI
jgi:DNA mismatch endonuclease (patch repair protein)